MNRRSARWLSFLWFVLIVALAALHALHLRADFPNHTPWFHDWAKYTDEGWYGNSAIRAHLFGNWYVDGDFNLGAAVPVWPFLEWILFFFTGVTVEAARGLAVAFFFANLGLTYLLVRTRAPRWAAMLAITMSAASPFLYAFSRLAILEPLLTAIVLTALNLAVRLPRMRRPMLAAAGIGVLFALAFLTKTTTIFLTPAFAWALIVPLWRRRSLLIRCCAAAAVLAIACIGGWLLLLHRLDLMDDFRYFFFINNYDRPPEWYWPIVSFWWSFHGGLWIDHVLIPLAGLIVLAAAILGVAWRSQRARRLLLDPVFGASALAVAGYILFMTYQNHPQPRYFAVVAVFSFVIVALGLAELVESKETPALARRTGLVLVGVAALAVIGDAAQTIDFATHPEYTFVTAAEKLARYIDEHPNGNRLLLSLSGDQLALISHIPALCDDFSLEELVHKLDHYKPGWWATWNDIDQGTLEDLHAHYSLEQAASFRAFDDPERNVLVLFKLHPLPNGEARELSTDKMRAPLPGDKIDIPID